MQDLNSTCFGNMMNQEGFSIFLRYIVSRSKYNNNTRINTLLEDMIYQYRLREYPHRREYPQSSSESILIFFVKNLTSLQ